MEFDWTPEQRQLRAQAVALGRSLNDGVAEDDADRRFPREKWDRAAAAGYLGLCVPDDLGGAGVDPMTGLLVYEGLGEGCEDTGLVFAMCVQAWVVLPSLLRFCDEEQRKQFIPALADGSAIGAFAVTEPGTGSDAFAMTTKATRVPGGWRLSGHKSYITNAPIADLIVCFARTTPERGPLAGITAFIVEAGSVGLLQAPASETMGLRTVPLGDLYLDDVLVPDSQVLGKVGRGTAVFNETMQSERIWSMAAQIGLLTRELDRACTYARERQSFGQPIGAHQSVANRLVDMRVRLETGRLLLYQAAWLKTRGDSPSTVEAAAAALLKYWVGECAVANSMDSMQVHGAYGYMTEAGLERHVRDAFASRIYSGTSDLCRATVARSMGL